MKAFCKACGLSLANDDDEKQARQVNRHNILFMAGSPSTSPRVYSALDKGLGDPLIWIVDVPHERRDNLKMQNVFPKLPATPCKISWAGPEELGQHNAQVYGKLLNMCEAE
jgi:hypothetical protein